MSNQDPKIGQYGLIIKNLSNNKIKSSKNINDDDICNTYQKKKISQIESHISMINNNFMSSDYKNRIMTNYIDWIRKIRSFLVTDIKSNNFYSFYKFDPVQYKFENMKDYWDVPDTEKLFSFSLFIANPDNLTYLIGLVYNYAIMRKHFSDYKMRLYIDFHSVFGSCEAFNIFGMFIDILADIDPTFKNNIQMIVFFLNPYYSVDNESIFTSITNDIDDVRSYYNNILYNANNDTLTEHIQSPLLNVDNTSGDTSGTNPNLSSNISPKAKASESNFTIDIDKLEVEYLNVDNVKSKSKFVLLSTHISVNLRFLPMNENCEFHVRDLDSRLSLTDKNIINKFNNPKYQYVPFYVFQFYKFYFPYLKWRIDVNPYLAGCFGGSNRKPVWISESMAKSDDLKILKKELFFKYILFISFNATNLQIGFLNDEFILANIFEKIKGTYSENILYLNLGAFANKHVNEYYYGLNDSSNYPCILKLGIPIDILRYPLNGKYLTIDPITDFKIGNIPLKYHLSIKNLITEQLKIYIGIEKNEKINLANKIRINYKNRLGDEISDDLESALFFSMIPKHYTTVGGITEFSSKSYTHNSFNNQQFSSIGDPSSIINNEKLKASNFMMGGYLLADILEDIIFPVNPQFINSNYFLSDDNYDRLFNCLYFDEKKQHFIQKKIDIEDLSRKYIDQNIIDIIPTKYLAFENKDEVKQKLNNLFNEYLKTCNYYSSLHSYVQDNIKFYKFIKIGNEYIKTGLLLFIKNYQEPIYSKDNKILNPIDEYGVRVLGYNTTDEFVTIDSVKIKKNKLKFNLMLLDDTNINQLTYHEIGTKSKINIKLIKSSHLDNLTQIMKKNKYNDFIIINKL